MKGRRDIGRFVYDWGDGGPLIEQRTALRLLAEELHADGREVIATMVSDAARFLEDFDRLKNAEKGANDA